MTSFWEVSRPRWLTCDPIITDEQGEDYSLFIGSDDRGLMMVALGNPEKVSAGLTRVRGNLPTPNRAIIEHSTLESLDPEHLEWLGPYRDNTWDMFYATEPVPVPDGGDKVVLLDRTEWRSEIERVLIASNKNTSAIRRIDDHEWYGYVEDGVLAGVMGVERHDTGEMTTSHFAGLGTDPEVQGRGIGTAVMSMAINMELEKVDLVNFGMWIENDRARRIYNKIGLVQGERMTNCSIEPFDH